MENLNEKQIQTLKELGNRTNGLNSDFKKDHVLQQWLVAYEYDVDKAEEAILKYVEWRKKNDIDNILSWDKPVLKNYLTLGHLGVDNTGSPVLIVPYGFMDVKGLIECVTQDEFVLYVMKIIETTKVEMAKQSKIMGKPVTQMVVIFDMDKFCYTDFINKTVFNSITEALGCFQAYYPEFMKTAYVINAPTIFQYAFKMLKHFLAPRLVEKVRIFDKSGWKEELLSKMSPSILPIYWGGQRKDADGDPKCPSVVCFGGKIPEEYYIKKKD